MVVRKAVLKPQPSTLSVGLLSKDERVLDPLERVELVGVDATSPLQDSEVLVVVVRSAVCVCEAVPPDPGGLKVVVASVRTEDSVSTKVLLDTVRVTRVVVVCWISKTHPTTPSCSKVFELRFPSPLDMLRWLQVLRPSPAHCLGRVSDLLTMGPDR